MTQRNPNDPNRVMLDRVARRLGPELCEQVVFVGGAAAGLLITDLASPGIRRTDDVDVITPAQALEDYHVLEGKLRKLGFAADMRPQAPLCRWIVEDLTIDVMPTREEILGFTNRWYVLGVATAQTLELPSGVRIKVIRAPEFIATKLEAFFGRGKGDFLFSHDLGDILSVIDGRDSIVTECVESVRSLREYLALHFSTLLQKSAFMSALPGHLPPDPASQARLPQLISTIRQIAQLPFD